MKFKRRFEWFLGFIFGMLTPMFGIAIFTQIYPVLNEVNDWSDPAWQIILMRLATFGVMLNVAVFFLSLKFNKDKIAMGVLWACVIYLAFLGIMQFLK